MGANEHVQIIENLGLIIISHNDILNQKSIENVISGLICNPFVNEKYNLLIDVRNSVIKMTSDEIKLLSNFVYENLKNKGIKKFAILATGIQTSKVKDFIQYNRQSSRYQVFSFINAVLNWLEIPVERKPQVKIKLAYLNENYLHNKLSYRLKLQYLYKLDYCRFVN